MSRSQRSLWDQQMRVRQVRWKREVAGVTEVGQHLGADRDYLFPDDLWFASVLADYRVAVTRSLARHQIARLRTYWELIEETKLFADGVFAGAGACPFYQDGYQLMRNQLLAATIEDDRMRPERRVDFVVLYHDGNPDILRPKGFPGAERGLSAWADILRRRDRFHIWPASQWIAAAPEELRPWRQQVGERYFGDEAGASL